MSDARVGSSSRQRSSTSDGSAQSSPMIMTLVAGILLLETVKSEVAYVFRLHGTPRPATAATTVGIGKSYPAGWSPRAERAESPRPPYAIWATGIPWSEHVSTRPHRH